MVYVVVLYGVVTVGTTVVAPNADAIAGVVALAVESFKTLAESVS
jgi:hypothetical protein